MPDEVELKSGNFSSTISRRLPAPLDKLLDDSEVAIFAARDESGYIYLTVSHPLIPEKMYFLVNAAVSEAGEQFILLHLFNPTMEVEDIPPSTIVRLDGNALQVLSSDRFLHAFKVLQKQVDERDAKGGAEQEALCKQDLKQAFKLVLSR